MKELIDAGFVGEVLSCHADCMRDGALERPSRLDDHVVVRPEEERAGVA